MRVLVVLFVGLLLSSVARAREPSVPSTTLAITVDAKTASYTRAQLQALPQKSVTVHNSHTNVDETYTGVLVSTLLARAGVSPTPAMHDKRLHSYVTAEGTDRYWVLYSLVELDGGEHLGDVIVALTLAGKPLVEDGAFQLVDSADKRPHRWVRNLAGITVKTLP